MPIQGIPSASIASQQARQVGEWGRHLGQKHFSWLDQRYAGAEVGDTIVGLAAELAADEGGRWTGGRLIRLYSYYYYYYYLGGR